MKTTEEKIADGVASVVILAAVLYFGEGVIVAWLHGAFQVVSK
jgi:hypothetical protein